MLPDDFEKNVEAELARTAGQTPDQVRRERDLLALSVSALQQEVAKHKRISAARNEALKSLRKTVKGLRDDLRRATS